MYEGSNTTMSEPTKEKFSELAKSHSEATLFAELWGFLRHNKRWWLLPVLIVLLLVGVLISLSGTAAAPFIYTLF